MQNRSSFLVQYFGELVSENEIFTLLQISNLTLWNFLKNNAIWNLRWPGRNLEQLCHFREMDTRVDFPVSFWSQVNPGLLQPPYPQTQAGAPPSLPLPLHLMASLTDKAPVGITPELHLALGANQIKSYILWNWTQLEYIQSILCQHIISAVRGDYCQKMTGNPQNCPQPKISFDPISKLTLTNMFICNCQHDVFENLGSLLIWPFGQHFQAAAFNPGGTLTRSKTIIRLLSNLPLIKV